MKTVSLELARQLKEEGYPQNKTYFLWYTNGNNETLITQVEGMRPFEYKSFDSPTADEILGELPPRLQFKKEVKKNPDWSIEFIPESELEELKHAGFMTIKNPDRWCVNYMSNACFGNQNMAEVFYDDNNLANAAAKAWLYLKRNKLI